MSRERNASEGGDLSGGKNDGPRGDPILKTVVLIRKKVVSPGGNRTRFRCRKGMRRGRESTLVGGKVARRGGAEPVNSTL